VISVGLPAFLWAGAAFALLPLALHFLTRRPPERQPLPTARFLRPDARTLLRFQRTPTDAALLALRLLFALLLGAAFADLSWQPAPTGSAHVVLLDGGSGWGDAWPEALETARPAAANTDVPGVVDADERLILVYGSANDSYVVPPGELTTVEPGDRTTTFDEGLRALREVTEDRRWSRVSAVWTTPGTWGQWTPGLAFRRKVLWPGAITWAGVAEAPAPADARTPVEGATPAGSAVAARPAVVEAQPGDALLTRAIQALGGTTESGVVVDTAGAIWFAAEGVGRADARDAWIEAGGTLVTAATDGVTLPTGGARRVLAVRNDATALATAERVGRGCSVRVEGSWSAIAEELGGGFPDFIRTLWIGCDDPGAGLALDSTAREQLTRPDLPLLVDTTDIGGSGVPLTRWILAILCLILAAEVALTRGNRRTGVRPVPEGGT
jgi:hypothetical protein